MPGVYVYGIAGRRPAAVRGIFGRRLRTIEAARLFAIVETATRAPRPGIARLRAQAHVLTSLVAAGTDILPSRFGSFAPRPADVRAELLARAPAFRRALRAVRGCVQLTARVEVASLKLPKAASPRSGAAYLRSRATGASAGSRHPAVRALNRAAGPFARMTRIEAARDGTATVAIHHLVPRRHVGRYIVSITETAARRRIPVSLSGPWPPFAFMDAE